MKSLTLLSLFLFALPSVNQNAMKPAKIYKKLAQYSQTLSNEFNQISEERKKKLEELGDYIYEKSLAGQSPILNVICTHNSRRSQMGQLWIMAASAWYGIENVNAFQAVLKKPHFIPMPLKRSNAQGSKLSALPV